MEKWRDPESKRDVWVVEVAGAGDFPAKVPWSCAAFGVLVLAEHVVDAEPLAKSAAACGVAVASAWGPAAAVIEDVFDDVLAGSDVVVTSHPYESIEETLETFLAIVPPRASADACRAWCIVAFGPELAKAARRALEHRGARPAP